MSAYARGEIYWVNFPKRSPRGAEIEQTRPCVVLSLTRVNEVRRTVLVVPLTSSPEPVPPIAVAVPSAGPGSVAVVDQLTAVDKGRLRRRVGALSAADLTTVEDSLRMILRL
jgi:mRNA interferase MazF